MGFRFRRSFKIVPGVRMNVSKTGVSTSIGKPGFTVNVRGDRVRETVGIPGTGLNYREEQRTSSSGVGALVLLVIVALVVIALLLGGCAVAPSQAAAQVKEADASMVAGCELIGTVVGSSMIGGIVTTGATNAMVEVREKAAALGATHIVFVSVDSGSTYSTGRAVARAYKCPASKVTQRESPARLRSAKIAGQNGSVPAIADLGPDALKRSATLRSAGKLGDEKNNPVSLSTTDFR